MFLPLINLIFITLSFVVLDWGLVILLKNCENPANVKHPMLLTSVFASFTIAQPLI